PPLFPYTTLFRSRQPGIPRQRQRRRQPGARRAQAGRSARPRQRRSTRRHRRRRDQDPARRGQVSLPREARRRQRGVALIALMAVIALTFSWILVAKLNAASGDFTAAKR